MAQSGFKNQFETLVNRQISILLGSLGSIFVLLIQAPLIGFFIGIAWQGTQPVQSTWFSMVIASVWLGCMNSCCSIVHERPIYERERMFSLNIFSFACSKMAVFSSIAIIQTGMMLYTVSFYVHIPTDIPRLFFSIVFLCLTAITSTGLGLLISSCARTSYGAVMTVPILLIPQVIFSQLMLQDRINDYTPGLISKFTITKWSYDALVSVGKSLDSFEWGTISLSMIILVGQAILFLLLTAMKLKLDDK